MTGYFIEDFAPPGRKPYLIRQRDGVLIERYSFESSRWIQDGDMLQIYTGDIESRPITEKEAKETIEQYKST